MSGIPRDRDIAPGAAEANVRVARWLVHGLAEASPRPGPLEVVISPGSRNTPLILAFDELGEDRARVHVVVDERAAGFVAVGLAKQTGRAAVLCCTSGSAAGHYVPAVMEASESRVPLVVVTADRPPELHRCGAPQTVAQSGMFALWARLSADLAPPDASAQLRRTVALGHELVRHAEGSPAGPVHLNVPFRKPLWTDALPQRKLPTSPVASPGRATLDAGSLDDLARALTPPDEPAGVIVVGPIAAATLEREALRQSVAALAERLGWPVFADPASGIDTRHPNVICGYDAFLRHPAAATALAPGRVLQLGAAPTSKATNQWLAAHAAGRVVLLDGDGLSADPNGIAERLVAADPVATCAALAARDLRRAPPSWLARFERIASVTRDAVAGTIDEPGWQGHLARTVVEALPSGALLHLASSMPIREVDAFAPCRGLDVQASRGVNGIDGTLATFLGSLLARAAGGSTAPGVALLGDLAMLHDVDGLGAWAALGSDLNATAVVVDNRGGRIFEMLPIARQIDAPRFERLFATPQRTDFGLLCSAFGHRHERVAPGALAATLVDELSRPGLGVLVVPIEPETDRAAHDRALSSLRTALDDVLPELGGTS